MPLHTHCVAHVQTKVHRVLLPDVYWKGCEEVATFLGVQKKTRGQGTLGGALMESLGNGAAVTAIATAHQGLFPHTQVRLWDNIMGQCAMQSMD